MTIQQQFHVFLGAVYREPPQDGSDQYNQLRDAFFAGSARATNDATPESEVRELALYLQETP